MTLTLKIQRQIEVDNDIYLVIVGNFEKSYDVFRRMCNAHIMHKCVYTHARPTPWPVRRIVR